jgi:hypothetical protein
MSIKLEVPHYTYEHIRKKADEFLSKYNPTNCIPVPIEEITEFSLGLNIIPIPDLQLVVECAGFISSDLRSISVDEFVMEHRIGRYRFTLAHEIGHLWLHPAVFQACNFSTIEGWKKFLSDIGEDSYFWLEWQVNAFAGLVLAPRQALASKLVTCQQLIRQEGMDSESEAAQLQISKMLAREFAVSPAVIDKRLQKDR